MFLNTNLFLNFKNKSKSLLVLSSLLLSFIFFAPTAQAKTEDSQNTATIKSIYAPAHKDFNTATANVTSSSYTTTNGKFTRNRVDYTLDKTIIFSLMSIILLGFIALFSAVGHSRTKKS